MKSKTSPNTKSAIRECIVRHKAEFHLLACDFGIRAVNTAKKLVSPITLNKKIELSLNWSIGEVMGVMERMMREDPNYVHYTMRDALIKLLNAITDTEIPTKADLEEIVEKVERMKANSTDVGSC